MKRCSLHYENVHLLQSSVLKASSYFQCSTALIASTWHLMTGQQIYSSSSWFPVLGHLIHLDIWDTLNYCWCQLKGEQTLKQMWVLWHLIKNTKGIWSFSQLIQCHFTFWNDLVHDYWLDYFLFGGHLK